MQQLIFCLYCYRMVGWPFTQLCEKLQETNRIPDTFSTCPQWCKRTPPIMYIYLLKKKILYVMSHLQTFVLPLTIYHALSFVHTLECKKIYCFEYWRWHRTAKTALRTCLSSLGWGRHYAQTVSNFCKSWSCCRIRGPTLLHQPSPFWITVAWNGWP